MKIIDWHQMKLDNTGLRIVIIGPSSSGKSTLAAALAARLDIPCHHLDCVAHIPGSNWKRRPNEDFIADHDTLIMGDKWVMDGDYSICMPSRFARASAVIWLDPPLAGTVGRYLWRCFADGKTRFGELEGAGDAVNLYLIKYTLVNYPKNREKYTRLLENHPDLPCLKIKSMRELGKVYRHWKLERPSC